MKTKIFTLSFFAFLIGNQFFAQDRTTVNANSQEISDNLDLKAVASIFGDASNLEDFERRLNDPKVQISNLDLNNDNQVDYLRVIESIEDNTHLIIVQAVLEKDVFQDVATIEVERDNNNRVQVQVVGDVYMYGNNYICEPVYVSPPIIYNTFWTIGYHPYRSSWYWGYYPSYYYVWNPYPIYRYRRNIGIHINHYHHYNYVNVRKSQRAAAMYGTRRSNGYETMHPNRSFAQRNSRVSNRYELDQSRRTSRNTRNQAATPTRNRNSNATPRTSTRNQVATPRQNRNENSAPRNNTRTTTSTPRTNRSENSTPRTNNRTNTSAPRGNRSENAAPTRNNQVRTQPQRGNNNPR